MNEGEDAIGRMENPSKPQAGIKQSLQTFIYIFMCVCVWLVSSHEPTAIITAQLTYWRDAKSDQAEINVS